MPKKTKSVPQRAAKRSASKSKSDSSEDIIEAEVVYIDDLEEQEPMMEVDEAETDTKKGKRKAKQSKSTNAPQPTPASLSKQSKNSLDISLSISSESEYEEASDDEIIDDEISIDELEQAIEVESTIEIQSKIEPTNNTEKSKRRKRKHEEYEVGETLEAVEEPDEDSFGYTDFSNLKLRPDHMKRPIWVLPDGRIFMETFGPNYRIVYDFLISIAHPIARTRLMHQYKLNHGSLYAATSIGLETSEILQKLEQFSKTEIPAVVHEYITNCTEKFGKSTLVLRKNQYYVESHHKEILEVLYNDQEIRNCTKSEIIESIEENDDNEVFFPTEMDVEEVSRQFEQMNHLPEQESTSTSNQHNAMDISSNHAANGPKYVYSFEIDGSEFETVKRRAIELGYPLLEEYDFSRDTLSETIEISLKPTTMLRRYQEKCLSKLFSHGRIKSGIISLACGAGKSLVGVTASSTTKKKTLVLCTSTVSVQQWIHQFLLWSNIHHHNVVGFTSGNNKHKIRSQADLGGVLVTTYNMLSHSSKRSGYSAHVVGLVEQVEWGLVILDEVHVVPANTFRSVISKVKSHCKLGLSATLVREDDLIEHLLYLIGPKLYEANWLDLCRAGHIANVCCAEVWCPMTAEFYKEYVVAESRRGRALYIMNPNKLRTCEHLIKFHEARNDKILVFSDDVFALKTYANLLGKPFIYGSTPNSERVQLLSAFQYNSNAKTLFISKIGDNSIDLPEATVLIQVSSHYGSRRQEAQRLGRILRPKSRTLSGRSFDAYFYSLVSQDTKEMYYSAKRQQFLIEQGYAFKIFKPMDLSSVSVMSTKESQITLLRKVLAADIETLREMETEMEEQQINTLLENLGAAPKNLNDLDLTLSGPVLPTSYSYTRVETGTTTLSGATGIEYDEIQEMLD